MPIDLYTDGGVILKNPSPYGGTWAYVLVVDGDKFLSASGYVTPEDIGTSGLVTNNQTELYAVVRALECLMSDEVATILSDSEITLGRVFGRYAMNNIPEHIILGLEEQKKRLSNFKQLKHVLLAGHPTKKQLKSGIGKNGHPVSYWNVECDHLCKRKAKEYVSIYLKP